MNPKEILLPGLLLFIMVLLVSCQSESGKFSYTDTVDLDDNITETDIKINAGSLNLTTFPQNTVVLEANYSHESWKPEMKVDKQSGSISIYQPDGKFNDMEDADHNDWKIKFPINLDTNLKLRIGAGEGIVDLANSEVNKMELEGGAGSFNINLANTSLSQLNVNAGVGELTLDLSGKQETDFEGYINGGIGAIKLTLPRKTGVRVKVNGLGSIDRNDLKKQNGFYVNDLYGKTSHNMEIEINGGLGSLELTLE